MPLAEPDPRLLKLVPTVARLVAGEIDQDPDRAIKGSAMREPDDRNVIRLIRELDAERTARKKAERHAKLLKAYAARLKRRLTTDGAKPPAASPDPR